VTLLLVPKVFVCVSENNGNIAVSRRSTKSVYRGVWNVPYINACYLVQGSILANEDTRPTYTSSRGIDPDMAFCEALRHDVNLNQSINFWPPLFTILL